jgi:hypothetical protein
MTAPSMMIDLIFYSTVMAGHDNFRDSWISGLQLGHALSLFAGEP